MIFSPAHNTPAKPSSDRVHAHVSSKAREFFSAPSDPKQLSPQPHTHGACLFDILQPGSEFDNQVFLRAIMNPLQKVRERERKGARFYWDQTFGGDLFARAWVPPCYGGRGDQTGGREGIPCFTQVVFPLFFPGKKGHETRDIESQRRLRGLAPSAHGGRMGVVPLARYARA